MIASLLQMPNPTQKNNCIINALLLYTMPIGLFGIVCYVIYNIMVRT